VLEHSIRKHATCDVTFTWMRAGDPGFEVTPDGRNGSWNIGREAGQAWPKRGWGTDFSSFRFAVPELCGFQGRSIYLDADMLVLGDVAEFLTMPVAAGYRCMHWKRTDVSLIDCGWFKGRKGWVPISTMKKSGYGTGIYCQQLVQMSGIDATLDERWNRCDPMHACADPGLCDSKLIHFTVVPTQPYKPYPSVSYIEHPWKSWSTKWIQYHAEALAAMPS
jgi:hypothetical protein